MVHLLYIKDSEKFNFIRLHGGIQTGSGIKDAGVRPETLRDFLRMTVILIPVETHWAAQHNTAEQQRSVPACGCPLQLNSVSCLCPPTLLLSLPSRLQFLLVYLLCRRSQASN